MNVEEQRERLDHWYGTLKNLQQDHADTQKSQIEANFSEITDPEMKKLYELLTVRYYLMCEDLERAAVALAETGPEADKYHWLNYYYDFFRGIYHYERKEYKLAIDYYNKARLFISDIPIEETAELYYKLASACNRIYQISRSIKYAERALEIFKDKALYKRMADCENLLGVNNQDVQQFKEAEQRYQDALIHVKKARDEILEIRILHNLGVLYSDQNKSEKSLEFLNRVYDFINTEKNQFHDEYLRSQSLYLLAVNHFKIDQSQKAREVLESGIGLSKATKNLTYFHRFNLLKAKFLEPSQFKEVYQKGISYYRENKRWQLVVEYGEELASYFRGTGEHKEAAEYFHLAAEARNQIKKKRMVSDDEKIFI
ncbi:MAG TPA: tetratricopeptide repeat protein [Bacillales bacterium]|nr:tetratricopeptide repeat protein [Bacillales bacterium]